MHRKCESPKLDQLREFLQSDGFLYVYNKVTGRRSPIRSLCGKLESEPHLLPVLLYGIHDSRSPSKILGHAANLVILIIFRSNY